MNAVTRVLGVAVVMLLALPASQALAQPVNDDCSNALAVVEGPDPVSFDLAGATNSLQGSCDPMSGVPDIWFSYTASGDGTGFITTCGFVDSRYGTTLTAYDSCEGSELACNAYACVDGVQAVLMFPVLSGQTYLIRLASVDEQVIAGSVRFTLIPRCDTPPAGAPENDCCATATPVGDGTYEFTTEGATRDYAGPCDLMGLYGDVWFDYTAPTSGFSKIRPALDAPQDIGITVLDGLCTGPEVACGADMIWMGDTRQIVFPTLADNHYLIRLFGFTTPSATGRIEISTVLPPPNDECETAEEIGGEGTFPYDNTLANDSGPDDAPACDGWGGMAIAKDVWFRWTNTLDPGNDAVVSLCWGTHVDTKIAVYADGCPVGSPIACNDDYCIANQSQLIFTPEPGASYMLRIGNWPGMGNEPGPDGKPGTFDIYATPSCILTAPAGAFLEPEACGETLNDGFPNCFDDGLFTDIPIGTTTIFGTAPVLGDVPDQDMYRVVLPMRTHVWFGGTAEFPMMLAILGTERFPDPKDPGSCYVDMFARWRFPSDLCEDPQMNPIETDLEAGTYAFAVANTLAYSDCTAKNNYIVTISTLPCIKGDLNFSGATDADDIGPFVDVLLADWPDMAIFCRADMNDDWSVDGQDIQPFIDCVLNPGMCP